MIRCDAFFDARKGRGETLGLYGFGEVVKRMNLKCTDCILVVPGYKYHNWYLLRVVLLALQGPSYLHDRLEASSSGHLDIQK